MGAPVTRTGNATIAAEMVAIGELRPWSKNPRKNERTVPKVADSIRRFGFAAPIVARRDNGEIIAGHTRWKAAQSLGLSEVPVRYMDLSEQDAHLLALADNRLTEASSWDDELLAEVLAEAQAEGLNLLDSGFDEHEVSELVGDSIDEPTGPAVESAPEKLQAKWQTKLGQLWVAGNHRILCGSSTEPADVARLMGTERADMMWTDPPYGVSYVGKGADALTIANDAQSPEALLAFLTDCFAAADAAALKPGAAWYVSHPAGGVSLQFRLATEAVGWVFRQGLVWVKDSMVLGRSDYHYKHEPIMFGYKAGAGRKGRGGDGWHGGNAETSVFEVPRPKVNELHPTMKPVELVARMVRNSSAPGELVYEPFSGSGTTLVACESTGRACRAIELDPKYVAVALERLSEMGLQPRLEDAHGG